MINAVVLSREWYPVIFIQPFRIIKIIDNSIGNPAVIGQLFFIYPEIYNGIIACIAIGKIKTIWKFLIRKWWVFIIALILGGGVGWLIHYEYGIKYTANCSFSVQGQSASSSLLNSALSLASSIGISAKPGTGSYDNNFFANLMK